MSEILENKTTIDIKEYVYTDDDKSYLLRSISPSSDQLVVTIADVSVNDAKAVMSVLKDIKHIGIGGEDKVIYGNYYPVRCASWSVNTSISEDNVTTNDLVITYSTRTSVESQIAEVTKRVETVEKDTSALQVSQTEQDDIISELVFGSDDEASEDEEPVAE